MEDMTLPTGDPVFDVGFWIKTIKRIFDVAETHARDDEAKRATKSARLRWKEARQRANVYGTKPSVYQQLAKIRNVRTILTKYKPISVDDFYYDMRIQLAIDRVIDGGKKRFKIGNGFRSLGSQVPGKKNGTQEYADFLPALLVGTVGQGKSVLLRHLVSHELRSPHKRIPVFFELREYRAPPIEYRDNWLLQEVALSLRHTTDIDIDGIQLRALWEEGLVSLILDGFDEVKEELKGRCCSDIEGLARIATKAHGPLIVSSRPGSPLENVASLTIFSILPLKPGEHEKMISRIQQSFDVSGHAMEKCLNVGPDVAALLDRPLSVAFFAHLSQLHSEAEKAEIETQLVERIDDVFVREHDMLKPSNGSRRFACGLGPSGVLSVYRNVCWEALRSEETTFTSTQMMQVVRRALVAADAQGQPHEVITTLANTGLIRESEDGYTLRSVALRDFHAARHVKDSGSAKIDFYKHVAANESACGLARAPLRRLQKFDGKDFANHFAARLLRPYLAACGSQSKDVDEIAAQLIQDRIRVAIFRCDTDAYKTDQTVLELRHAGSEGATCAMLSIYIGQALPACVARGDISEITTAVKTHGVSLLSSARIRDHFESASDSYTKTDHKMAEKGEWTRYAIRIPDKFKVQINSSVHEYANPPTGKAARDFLSAMLGDQFESEVANLKKLIASTKYVAEIASAVDRFAQTMERSQRASHLPTVHVKAPASP